MNLMFDPCFFHFGLTIGCVQLGFQVNYILGRGH